MKPCIGCRQELPLSEFSKHPNMPDGTINKCKPCVCSDQKRRANRNRQFVLEYLKDKSCMDCGNSDIRVLEFDHVTGVKIDAIANFVAKGLNLQKIKDEIPKCEVVCCNCHRIRTYKRIPNSWRNFV